MKLIKLLNKHCNFESDYDCYVLLGIARKKNNEFITNSQEVVLREIIKNKDNIEKKYNKICTQCKSYRTIDDKKLNFYIYISVNPRNALKGFLTFKMDLLKYEREMLYGISMHNQLKRLDSIWLSSMMKPESRSSNNRYFMLDIDTKDKSIIRRINRDLSKFTNIILKQETKNGWHYIVNPYNKQMGKDFNLMEIKTDALLFIKYIKGD